MPKILKKFTIDPETADSDTTRIIVILSIVVGLSPLALQRNLSGLAHFSFVGNVAIIYFVILLVVQTPWYINDNLNFSFDKLDWVTISLNSF